MLPGNAEVIVVDNDPGGAESKMLDEFPKLKQINNPTQTRGSAANFKALDIGLQHAANDLVGLLHSDTIFCRTAGTCNGSATWSATTSPR